MASTTPRDILQYFHSAHMELFRNTKGQNIRVKGTQLQRLCNRAIELAANTKHSTIVKEFAQSCSGDDAVEENRWAMKKTLLGRPMAPNDRQALEKEIACFIADFGEGEVKEESDGASAPVKQEPASPVGGVETGGSVKSEEPEVKVKLEEPKVKDNAERQDVRGKAEKEEVKIKVEQ